MTSPANTERDKHHRFPAEIFSHGVWLYYHTARFAGEETVGRALLEPGLFSRFRYGADIEFLCVDTSKQSLLSGDRLFTKEKPLQFLAQALPAADGTLSPGPSWRIPFMHHPPYTAGPKHHNSRSIIRSLPHLFLMPAVGSTVPGVLALVTPL